MWLYALLHPLKGDAGHVFVLVKVSFSTLTLPHLLSLNGAIDIFQAMVCDHMRLSLIHI